MAETELESLPIIDFQDIVEIFGSEEQAIMMLDMFDKILRAKQEFLKLLDSILYENADEVKFWGHKIKGAAGIVSASRMKKYAEIVQNAGRDKDLVLAKEKFADLLKETEKAHRKSLEILNTPTEEIGQVLSESYELFHVYTKEKEPAAHINLAELEENYGDLEMGFGMLQESLRPAFTEMNLPEKFYTYLMEQNFHELREAAHKLKGRCSYVCLPKMVEVTDKLKVAARERQEEECYQYLIEVLDECIFMERYIMIKKLQNDEPREKWINLNPELVKLLEGRDNLPDLMNELKTSYKVTHEESKNESEEKPTENNTEENLVGSSQNANEQQQEISIPIQEEVKVQTSNKELKVSPTHFHENTIKTVLEPIPETEEKEKEEVKQNEPEEEKKPLFNNGKEVNSISESLKYESKKSSEKLPGSSDTIQLEESKGEREELHSSKLGRSRTNINLEEIKEFAEEGSEATSNLLRKSSSRVLTDHNENNSSRAPEIKIQDSLPKEKSAPLLIISSKKKRIKEEQVTDDDYPFDSGLKCNIF